MGRTVITKKDIPVEKGVSGMPAGLELGALRAPETKEDQQPPSDIDTYSARLMKYIPAEVIAVYLTLESILRSSSKATPTLYWLIFAFGLIGTPLYLFRIQKVSKTLQVVISTGAFVVWVFAMQGPFSYLSWYNPLYGALLLPAYTFLIALVEA